jgi:hypothetical protein
MIRIATALAMVGAALALTACGGRQAITQSTAGLLSSPSSSLATAHLGCHFYAGGSAADPSPNVVITVTAGATPVTGTIAQVTVGGPDSSDPSKTDTQIISVGKTVNVASGQTEQLGPFDTGDNSPLGNIIATVNCTVLSYRT